MLSTEFLRAKDALIECQAAGRKRLDELPTKNWVLLAHKTMLLSSIATLAAFGWALWKRQWGTFKWPVVAVFLALGSSNLKSVLSGTSLSTRLLAKSIADLNILNLKTSKDISKARTLLADFRIGLIRMERAGDGSYFETQFCLEKKDVELFKERIARVVFVLQIFAIPAAPTIEPHQIQGIVTAAADAKTKKEILSAMSALSVAEESQNNCVRETLKFLTLANLPPEIKGKILGVLYRLWPAIVPKPEGLELPAFTAVQTEKWLACRTSLENLDQLFENPDTYANAVMGPKT